MGDGGGGQWLVRMEWRQGKWSVCLPLLIIRCTIKSRSSLLAPAHRVVPEKGPQNRCVCVLILLLQVLLLLVWFNSPFPGMSFLPRLPPLSWKRTFWTKWHYYQVWFMFNWPGFPDLVPIGLCLQKVNHWEWRADVYGRDALVVIQWTALQLGKTDKIWRQTDTHSTAYSPWQPGKPAPERLNQCEF